MFFYIKSHWAISLLVAFLQILVWGMQALVQVLLIKTFDAALSLDFTNFINWTLISLGSWSLYFLIGIIEAYFQGQAIRSLNNQVRHDLYRSIIDKNHLEYHSLDSGQYISWISNDIKQIEKLAWEPFFNSIGRLAQVFWSILVLAWIDWILLVAAIFTALIMWILPRLFEENMEKLARKNSEIEGKAISNLKDLISGLDTLHIFGRQALFLEKADSASDEIEVTNYRLKYTQAKIGGVIGIISVSLQIMSNVLILLLVFAGRVNLSVMAGASNLISGVSNGFDNIAKYRLSISASKAYFNKIQARPEKTIDEKIKRDEIIGKSISIEELEFSYGKQPVLSDINMYFKKGGKYALIGPSGSGKTSLLKLILGWQRNYRGSIKFDGLDSRNYSVEEIQKEITYIQQDVFLFNSTIIKNITLDKEFPKNKIEEAIENSALKEDLLKMPEGLETIVGEAGENISGGQRQRIAIARALLYNRSILFLDEATSGLDKENADIVEGKLLENPDLTLVFISHHLSEERKKEFDRVYELKKSGL